MTLTNDVLFTEPIRNVKSTVVFPYWCLWWFQCSFIGSPYYCAKGEKKKKKNLWQKRKTIKYFWIHISFFEGRLNVQALGYVMMDKYVSESTLAYSQSPRLSIKKKNTKKSKRALMMGKHNELDVGLIGRKKEIITHTQRPGVFINVAYTTRAKKKREGTI